jgi:hypothetical protein
MSSTEKTYEMMWDCEYCNTKKLLGLTQRFCPQCGAPQNPAKRYFPPDDEKVAVQDHKFVGADRTCPACKHPMSQACNNCSNCGSPLDGSKQVAMQGEQVLGAGGQWQPTAQAGAPAEKKSKLPMILGIIALAVVALIVVRCTMKRDAQMTVARHEWTREIHIEKYQEVDEKGPCSSVPSDARVKSRNTPEPKCTTKKIDNGDGTFKEKKECDQPVEQCSYTVNKWQRARSVKESGGLDKEPAWPVVNVRSCTSLGCEREASERTEKYTVYFAEDGKKDELKCDFGESSKWKSFEKGSKWKGKVHSLGGDLDCSSLQKP